MSIKDFKNNICIALTGRTAQVKLFGEIEGMDTGASNDIQQATRDAYAAIAYYGMVKDVGYINIDGIIDANEKHTHTQSTEHYHQKIDNALERWMMEGEKKTIELVDKYWDTILKLSKLLLEKEIIYSDELDRILS